MAPATCWSRGRSGKFRYSEWPAGLHDAYLDQVAAAARAFPYVMYVRPWPEMNGDWTSFQPTPAGEKEHGGTPEEFVAAWRYVVTYLRDRGATNLRWVFNPTTDTYEGTTDIRAIYPGDDYVDVLGLDGYNWGNTGLSWGQWRTFEDIYREQYDRLVALHPTAPVWICEVGCKEPSYDDGAPRIKSASQGTLDHRDVRRDHLPAGPRGVLVPGQQGARLAGELLQRRAQGDPLRARPDAGLTSAPPAAAPGGCRLSVRRARLGAWPLGSA